MKQNDNLSTLTRSLSLSKCNPLLKPLSMVFAIVLMAMTATPTFAQSVNIDPTSQTIEQGEEVVYTINADGWPNFTTFTLDWCTSSGGRTSVPPGVTNIVRSIVAEKGTLTIITAATTPPGTY